MQDSELLQKTLELLGVSREELEHLVDCRECSEPFDSENGWHCDQYKRQFWGWTPPIQPVSGLAPDVQRLWSREILHQAMAGPLFRYIWPKGEDSAEEA